MKTQENSAEKLLNIIEEKDRRIAELEQQVQWFIQWTPMSRHDFLNSKRHRGWYSVNIKTY